MRPPARRPDCSFIPAPCPLPLIAPLENPPRSSLRALMSSVSVSGGAHKELSDYNPARGEFRVEYDNFAEREANFVGRLPAEEELLWPTGRRRCPEEEDSRLLGELAVAVFESYNRRLRRRAAVKRLVREHGLISRRRVLAAAGRYKGLKCAAWSGDRLRMVSQLLRTGEEMDRLLEALLLEADIKCNILKLQKLRTDGEYGTVPYNYLLHTYSHCAMCSGSQLVKKLVTGTFSALAP